MIAPAPQPAPASADVLAWLAAAPPGTLVLASEIAAQLNAPPQTTRQPVATPTRDTWRERIWTVPADTRLGVREVAEALDRSADYVYRHTGPAGNALRIPHRKLDGQLVFVAGEVRIWLTNSEIVVSTPVLSLRTQRGPLRKPLRKEA